MCGTEVSWIVDDMGPLSVTEASPLGLSTFTFVNLLGREKSRKKKWQATYLIVGKPCFHGTFADVPEMCVRRY